MRQPGGPPWNAIIIDDNQSQQVCVVRPDFFDGGTDEDAGVASFADAAAVCQGMGPTVPAIDAGVNVEGTGSDAAGD